MLIETPVGLARRFSELAHEGQFVGRTQQQKPLPKERNIILASSKELSSSVPRWSVCLTSIHAISPFRCKKLLETFGSG